LKYPGKARRTGGRETHPHTLVISTLYILSLQKNAGGGGIAKLSAQ